MNLQEPQQSHELGPQVLSPGMHLERPQGRKGFFWFTQSPLLPHQGLQKGWQWVPLMERVPQSQTGTSCTG